MMGGMDIEIKLAQIEDFPEITAIYAASVRTSTASFELDPPDEEEMTRRWTDTMIDGCPYLTAFSGNKVMGFAYASPYRPRPAYRYTVECSIYIAKAARRRGIGSQLLSRLITLCEEASYRQMVAVIGDTDNPASEALHQKLGFQTSGRWRNIGYKHGRWRDCLIMQRAMGDGAATPPD